MQPLKISLFPKKDTDKQIFYIGKLKFPGKITFDKGASFNVYIDDDISELHITMPTGKEPNDPLKSYKQGRKTGTSKHNNIAIELNKKRANENQPQNIYRGNIRNSIELNADGGLVFLVFIADSGEEELQISMPEDKKTESKNKKHYRRRIIENV